MELFFIQCDCLKQIKTVKKLENAQNMGLRGRETKWPKLPDSLHVQIQ